MPIDDLKSLLGIVLVEVEVEAVVAAAAVAGEVSAGVVVAVVETVGAAVVLNPKP